MMTTISLEHFVQLRHPELAGALFAPTHLNLPEYLASKLFRSGDMLNYRHGVA